MIQLKQSHTHPILLMFLLIALLSACTTAESSAPTSETDKEEPAAVDNVQTETNAESTTVETVVITHPQGETTIPKNPQRVVVMNFSALDTLDKLEANIVGLPQGPLVPPSLEKYNGEAYANVGTFFEPDYEKINELKPDLIVIGLRTAPFYEDMSAIAPTIDVTVNTENYRQGFEDYVTNLGIIFDKEAEVAQYLAEIDQAIAEVKTKAEESDLNALIVLTSGGEVSAYGPASRFGMIHDMMGVTPVVADIEAVTHGDAISFEFILEHNPDILYIIDRDSAVGETSAEAAKQIMDNDLVKATTAWENDKLIYLDAYNWYLANAGLTSLSAMIDEVATGLQ